MTRIVTMTINMDIWVGDEKEEPLSHALTQVMDNLNYRDLEEYGGCKLLQYFVTDITDDSMAVQTGYNVHTMYKNVESLNKGINDNEPDPFGLAKVQVKLSTSEAFALGCAHMLLGDGLIDTALYNIMPSVQPETGEWENKVFQELYVRLRDLKSNDCLEYQAEIVAWCKESSIDIGLDYND